MPGNAIRELGTSRSTLAERFAGIVGIPPMQYLANWRMQVAANRLLLESDKVYSIAHAVGYDSEVAFSRAFKRIVGMSPKAWRERLHDGSPTVEKLRDSPMSFT